MTKANIDSPLQDLEKQSRIKQYFGQQASNIDAKMQQQFSDFILAWEPIFDHIANVREAGKYDIGESQLRGRIFVSEEAGLRRVFLLMGFTESSEELSLESAGIVLSAPFARMENPDLFFDDYKIGLGEGTFTKMKEDDARLAVRYSMNVEAIRDYNHRFPAILTPMRERMIVENLNAWIVDQVHINITTNSQLNQDI